MKDIADVAQGPKIRLGHMARANHMEDGRIIDEPDVIQGVGADAQRRRRGANARGDSQEGG